MFELENGIPKQYTLGTISGNSRCCTELCGYVGVISLIEVVCG